MKDLFEAIYSKFDNHPELKGLVTDMYLTEAPQGTAFPYIVYSLVSNVPHWTFTEDFENALIQFNIFSEKTSATETLDIQKLLFACYDWQVLNFGVTPAYYSIYLKRELNRLVRVDNIWQAVIQYRIELETY